MVESSRRGQVSIANPVGSGVLENPALPVFLPAIARRLLDQDLLLPSVKTWWGGRPEDLAFALDNLDQLIVKVISRDQHPYSVYGPSLGRDALDTWSKRIQRRPRDFVFQSAAQFASAPAWVDGHLASRFNKLRCFMTASNGSYAVMPVPESMAWSWFAGVFGEFLVGGVILGLVYRVSGDSHE